MNRQHPLTGAHAIEARLAARLAGSLTTSAERLPHDIGERLRVAREQAVARARTARLTIPAGYGLTSVSPSGAAVLGGFTPWWQRAVSVLPLVALVAGLIGINVWTAHEQVMEVADIDAQLLSDTLPPAAYSDPGFAEFLRTGPEP